MPHVASSASTTILGAIQSFLLWGYPVNEDSATTLVTQRSGRNSLPVWFWVISVVALLWYLMDTSAFFMRVSMTEEAIESMPENQQHLYRDMPLWVNIVFACEVFGGTLGCISLLLRKKWALPLFVISLLSVLAQTSNIWFLTDAISAMGAPAVVMPLVAIIIGTALIFLAKTAISKGWLR